MPAATPRDPKRARRSVPQKRRRPPRATMTETPDWAVWLVLGVLLVAGVYGLTLAFQAKPDAQKLSVAPMTMTSLVAARCA